MPENGRLTGRQPGGQPLLQHRADQVFCPEARKVLQIVQVRQAQQHEVREEGTTETGPLTG